MDEPSDSLILNTMIKDEVVLFLIAMIIWDCIRAFGIAWLIPRLAPKKKK